MEINESSLNAPLPQANPWVKRLVIEYNSMTDEFQMAASQAMTALEAFGLIAGANAHVVHKWKDMTINKGSQ
jgi:hypothetical protein